VLVPAEVDGAERARADQALQPVGAQPAAAEVRAPNPRVQPDAKA